MGAIWLTAERSGTHWYREPRRYSELQSATRPRSSHLRDGGRIQYPNVDIVDYGPCANDIGRFRWVK